MWAVNGKQHTLRESFSDSQNRQEARWPSPCSADQLRSSPNDTALGCSLRPGLTEKTMSLIRGLLKSTPSLLCVQCVLKMPAVCGFTKGAPQQHRHQDLSTCTYNRPCDILKPRGIMELCEFSGIGFKSRLEDLQALTPAFRVIIHPRTLKSTS